MLTDEQCDEFRRMNCNFNDMVRAIYEAGYNQCLADVYGDELVMDMSNSND